MEAWAKSDGGRIMGQAGSTQIGRADLLKGGASQKQNIALVGAKR